MRNPILKPTVLVLVLACSLFVPTFSAEAAISSKPQSRMCGAPGATLLQNRFVRVYVEPAPRGDGGEAYVACGIGNVRPRQVGGSVLAGSRKGRSEFVLAGWFIARDGAECYYERCAGGVEVLDMRTGRVWKNEVSKTAPEAAVGLSSVTSLVLNVTGTVAWIRQGEALEPPFPREVYAMPFGKPARLLDAAIDVDPTSLASNGRTLYWIRGGIARATQVR